MHHQLRLRASCGQHVWLDELSRGLIESGELDRWIARGVSGITTNPTLFERALLERHDLAADVRCLAAAGLEPAQIHESLALEDVREAADRLRGAFDASDGATGFVSIGIDPEDAVDQERAIGAGLRLSRRAHRPNVMIKMPATEAVLAAVPALLAQSVPLNLTLILGERQHAAAWDAWRSAAQRLDGGAPPAPVALSVAVNPIDAGIDAALGDVAGLQDWSGAWCLHGCGALAVATRIYERHVERQRLCAAQWGGSGGAHAPRLVWASTGVGGAGDDPLLYARGLPTAGTTLSLPRGTLETLLTSEGDAGTPRSLVDAEAVFAALARQDIDLDRLAAQMAADGMQRYAAAAQRIRACIAALVAGDEEGFVRAAHLEQSSRPRPGHPLDPGPPLR